MWNLGKNEIVLVLVSQVSFVCIVLNTSTDTRYIVSKHYYRNKIKLNLIFIENLTLIYLSSFPSKQAECDSYWKHPPPPHSSQIRIIFGFNMYYVKPGMINLEASCLNEHVDEGD